VAERRELLVKETRSAKLLVVTIEVATGDEKSLLELE
jgi:hypothetical protein